jgi:hypothetical protein
MVNVELNELKSETETWVRTLKLLQAENIGLKQQLAEVIRQGIDNELLPALEYYHSFFIEEDRMLLLFFNDIKNQELLLRSGVEEEAQVRQLVQQQEKIRRQMAKVETVFYKKKQGFARLIAGRC